VAVRVPNRSEGHETTGTQPGLFAELPTGRGLRGFVRLDAAAREFPEAGQEALRRPSLDQPSTGAVREDHHGGPVVGAAVPLGPGGERAGVVEFPERPARERDRAGGTVRTDGPADGLAQLHHRFVEPSRLGSREDGSEGPLEPGADRRVLQAALFPGPSGRHAKPVRLERHARLTERDRGDRPRDVRPDPRQGLELIDGRREAPSSFPHDGSRGRVEVVGARVVPRALPQLEDAVDRSAREGLDRGEGEHEPLEVRDRLLDAGLLEQHLRHPDPVRVSVDPPRERAPVVPEPPEERRCERRGEGHRGGRSGTHGPRRVPDEAEA